MTLKQISIFIENKEGRMKKAIDSLAKKDINIRALSLADTSKYGILRLVVSDNELTIRTLEEEGFIVRETEVLGIVMPDTPNGLNSILEVLEKENINIEYLYAFVSPIKDKAIVVMRIDNIKQGKKLLKENGMNIITKEEIKQL